MEKSSSLILIYLDPLQMAHTHRQTEPPIMMMIFLIFDYYFYSAGWHTREMDAIGIFSFCIRVSSWRGERSLDRVQADKHRRFRQKTTLLRPTHNPTRLNKSSTV